MSNDKPLGIAGHRAAARRTHPTLVSTGDSRDSHIVFVSGITGHRAATSHTRATLVSTGDTRDGRIEIASKERFAGATPSTTSNGAPVEVTQ